MKNKCRQGKKERVNSGKALKNVGNQKMGSCN